MRIFAFTNLEMNNRSADLILYLLLSFLVWMYLIMRAIHVPFAHDEIATFHYYVQTGEFLPFLSHWDMNNHVVNSALSALFYSLFGLSPLVLRLANLLAFPIFCLYLWKNGKLIPGTAARWIFIASLLLSHGLAEFFSLSRGYGLSIAFLMPALYFTLKATEAFSLRRMLAAMGWAILATLSNLALINTFLILTAWMLLLIWSPSRLRGTSRKLSGTLLLVLTGLAPVALFALISFKARSMGLLYTGGSKGFFTETVKTLIPKLTGFDHWIVYAVVGALFLFAAGYGIYRIIRTHAILHPDLVFLTFLSANILSYWALNRFFQVNYPENRVALYLFPLFAGAVCFAAGGLSEQLNRRYLALLAAPLLFFPVHFAYSLNLNHSDFYIEDPVPVAFFDAVKAAHEPGEYPPTVGGHRLRHFCWSFHDFQNRGTESQLTFSDYPGTTEDFQIVDGSEISKFSKDYALLLRYPPNDRCLLKRNGPLSRTRIAASAIPDTPQPVTEEFFSLFGGPADTLAGKTLYIGFTGMIEAASSPFEAWIVAEVRDAAGTAVCYEKLALNWLRPEWKGERIYLKNGILVPVLPAEARLLKVYLWNVRRAPFRCEKGRIEVYQVGK